MILTTAVMKTYLILILHSLKTLLGSQLVRICRETYFVLIHMAEQINYLRICNFIFGSFLEGDGEYSQQSKSYSLLQNINENQVVDSLNNNSRSSKQNQLIFMSRQIHHSYLFILHSHQPLEINLGENHCSAVSANLSDALWQMLPPPQLQRYQKN